VKRHDDGLMWAYHDVANKEWRLWRGEPFQFPPEFTAHILVPERDYNKLRAAYFAAQRDAAKKARGKK
jgi:hypothetical protein